MNFHQLPRPVRLHLVECVAALMREYCVNGEVDPKEFAEAMYYFWTVTLVDFPDEFIDYEFFDRYWIDEIRVDKEAMLRWLEEKSAEDWETTLDEHEFPMGAPMYGTNYPTGVKI